jgi:hypothetical protein
MALILRRGSRRRKAMDRLEMQAREAVKRLGRRGRTQRIPAAVREPVIAYARAARARGVSWRRIAKAVGLSSSGVQRFASARRRFPPRRAALVPVALRPPASETAATSALLWITPSGHRLERLSLEDAVALLRALG